MTNDQTGRTPRQTTGGSPAASTIMTVVAVVIGFFILKKIRDDGDSTSASRPTTSVSPGGATTTTAAGGVPTTVAPTTPADVKTGTKVEVANSSGVGGAAGKLTTDLKAAGFDTATATNGTAGTIDTTVVY